MLRQNTTIERQEEKLTGGWLFFVIISLIVVVGYATVIKDTLHQQVSIHLTLVTGLVIAHIALLWFSPRLIFKRRGIPIYFALQGMLAFFVGMLTPGYWLAIMLYLSLTGMAVSILWPDLRMVAAAVLLGLALSTYHLVVSWGWRAISQHLTTLGLSLAFVVAYVGSITRQTQARQRAQALLSELEIAHNQLKEYADRVEELTITQERQRMAQELHDTLAQGLTGLLMQLEAIDIHLEDDNTSKAQQTVQQAMVRTRTTLHEARRAIRALRPAVLEQNGLINALSSEVDAFEVMTGVHATFQINSGPLDVSLAVAQDILRIVQESLTNIRLHAGAENLMVRVESNDNKLRVLIKDDGCGFDPEKVTGLMDSFGIQGMKERAEHIGGELQVRSVMGRGTTVTLEMEMAHDPRAHR